MRLWGTIKSPPGQSQQSTLIVIRRLDTVGGRRFENDVEKPPGVGGEKVEQIEDEK